MFELPQAKNSIRKSIQTYTFGCKVNLFDTVSIENQLKTQLKASINSEREEPQAVIVNTCTVTASADRQARQLIRKLHRRYPQARILVTGCYAQAQPQALREIPGVAEVIPIQEQSRIPELLGARVKQSIIPQGEFSKRTRAFLKIQDGCNAYCSFCVLPFIRGRSRSIDLKEICDLAKAYEQNGYQEIVVTGTHMGAYGRDLVPRIRFSDALKAIMKAAPKVFIRISSLEPTTLTKDVIRLVSEQDQIRPHFHIPLQSGSDSVLRRMNRKYKVKNYQERIEALSKARSKVAIGADVIVGYPEETEAEFQKTLECIESFPLTYLHVFSFSARPGTRAERFLDNVPSPVKKQRVTSLRKVSLKKRNAFYKQFINRTVPVLVEKKRDKSGWLRGYTPHYVPVRMKGPNRLMEREVDVKLLAIEPVKADEVMVLGEVL